MSLQLRYQKSLQLSWMPSPAQCSVWKELQFGDKNIVIKAVAGSGKTTTIVHGTKLINQSCQSLFLAFNKSIVQELKTRLPRHIDVSTTHSWGMKAIRSYYGHSVKVDGNKYKKIIKKNREKYSEVGPDDLTDYCNTISKLVDLARYNVVKSAGELKQAAKHHSLILQSNELERALETIREGFQDKSSIDFVDMIYLPAILKKMPIDKYDLVFIDEAQDLNKAQQMIVERLIGDEGRFIAVGDPKQAIYGFAGADADSFDNLTKIPNTVVKPLNECYRCPKSVIKKVQRLVPYITCPSTAEEGEQRYGLFTEIQEGDLVLCRTNAPLVKMCLEFIRNKQKAYVKGRDIGSQIIKMIARQEAPSNEVLYYRLESEELGKIAYKLMKSGLSPEEAKNHNQYLAIQDQIDIIKVIGETNDSPDSIIGTIKDIFENQDEGVCLSSIHKAKGLESDNVFLICPQLMPLIRKGQQAWERDQEDNLIYVAETRPKKKLITISEKEWSMKSTADLMAS